jgi:hypothetical protein
MTRAAFRTLIEEIASVEPGALRDADTRGTVKDWSSLVDVQIMAVIASELGLGEEAETLAYETVGELLDHLEERGAFSAI